MKFLGILLAAPYTIYACETSADGTETAPAPASSWSRSIFWGAVGMGGSALKTVSTKVVGAVWRNGEIDRGEEPPTSSTPDADRKDGDENVGEGEEKDAKTDEGRDSMAAATSKIFDPAEYTNNDAPFNKALNEPASHSDAPIAAPTVSHPAIAQPAPDSSAELTKTPSISLDDILASTGTGATDLQRGFVKVFNETTEFKKKQSEVFWIIFGLVGFLIVVPVPLTYYLMVVRRKNRRHLV